MFAFSDKYQSYKTFSGVCLTMEGQDKALQIMRPLFEELGHRVFTVKAENKAKYHAAAALASNCMIGLFQSSLHLLEACGFSEEDSRILLEPLVRNNVEAMLAHPAAEVLTGPVERNDVETVQKHLEVLQGQNAELVYRSIGRELLGIAEKKNPDRDYTALKQLL
jgi:predicted short-subunit dehydrogenase-like oxidoreductase (DUF2520 family)